MNRPFYAFLLLCLTIIAQTVGVFAQSVTLVGHLDKRHGGPGPSFGFYYASCWGYVAPDGHEYALIGTYSGTSIIDLDADSLREVAYIPGANSEWKELKTWGQYAYCVSEGSQGVQIINLSQLPDTAWLVRSVSSLGGKNISRNHTVTVADGYLYLNGTTAGGLNGGAIILSLADPENPVYVGEYQPTYLHDTYVRRDTLYGAGIYGEGVFIASLQNKANPQTLGIVTYANSGTHNTWVSTNGHFLFTTDEIGGTQKNLKVFELNQFSPTFSFTPRTPFTPNPSAVIHNIHGRGNYIYIAHYAAGVYVADAHDPLAITNAGGYDTYTGTATGYIGCWGVYPYFPSGRWIASDTQTGLYVFTSTGLIPRSRSPLLQPADGDTARFDPTAMFSWRSAALQSEDPHYYALHIWGNGIDTSLNASDTSLVVNGLPGLQNGETYSWHVWIKDEFTTVSSQDTFQFVYSTTATGVDDRNVTPMQYELAQNYPNPFNPATVIHYQLATSDVVSLKVYDILGREVAILVDGMQTVGSHRVEFNASIFVSGVYFYRLKAGNFVEQKKMVLMK
ncbi:MAG: choice-of-anchor B family protein [Bacteroidota bacterium]